MAKASVLETENCGFESHPVYQFFGDECKVGEQAALQAVPSGFESRRPFQAFAGIAKRPKAAVCKTANHRFKSVYPLQNLSSKFQVSSFLTRNLGRETRN